jgi:hypothetical protein
MHYRGSGEIANIISFFNLKNALEIRTGHFLVFSAYTRYCKNIEVRIKEQEAEEKARKESSDNKEVNVTDNKLSGLAKMMGEAYGDVDFIKDVKEDDDFFYMNLREDNKPKEDEED